MSEKKSMQDGPLEDEIDLREILNIIIKRKKVILGIFGIAVIIAGIIGFSKPRVYRASASLMVMASSMQQMFPQADGLGEKAQGYLSVASLAVHKELLKSDSVLNRVINRLDLKDRFGNRVAVDDFLKKLNVLEIKNTNILQLIVIDVDAEMAKEIVNIWAEEYVKYSREFVAAEAGDKNGFIDDQFRTVQKNLILAEEKIKDFESRYHLDLMNAELEMKKNKFNEYKKECNATC